MTTIKLFFKELLEKVPELIPVYEEHLSDYDELLPHVFMADVSRFVISLVDEIKKGYENTEQKLSKILDCLESALIQGDEEVKNVITVSFLENLERNSSYYNFLKNRLGKQLRSNLIKFEEFYS